MTVNELIEKLREYPVDTPVSIGSNGWGKVALVVTVPYPDAMNEDDVQVVPVLKEND